MIDLKMGGLFKTCVFFKLNAVSFNAKIESNDFWGGI